MREREKTNNTKIISVVRRAHESGSLINSTNESNVTTYNSTTSVLNSINDIFARQVDRFRIKVSLGAGLDHVENKMLTEIQKSLLAFEKHQLDMSKNAELLKQFEGLTDAELKAKVANMLGDPKIIDMEPTPAKESTRE